MGWHGEAPFRRFGEPASNSVFGLCDFGMRLLVARERQTRFARWTFPSDDDNQMKMSLPKLARHVDPGIDREGRYRRITGPGLSGGQAAHDVVWDRTAPRRATLQYAIGAECRRFHSSVCGQYRGENCAGGAVDEPGQCLPGLGLQRGQHARNDLPAVPPVDAEIAVRRQQHGIIQRLGHADKAGIRETHRHVGIFLQQLQDGIHVVGETIVADESASAKQ